MKTGRVNQRGSAILMLVLGMVLIAGMGTGAVSLVSTLESSRTASMTKEQAFGLSQAGLEYAKERLTHGLSPVVAQQAFGTGTFTVTADPVTNAVVSTGTVGTARAVHSITSNFSKNCTNLDTATAHSAGPNLSSLKLGLLACHQEAIITQWQLTWNPDLGERVTLLQVQGEQITTLFDNPTGYPSGTVIDATDYVLAKANGVNPINKMQFNQAIPAGKTFFITLFFADGSQLTDSFIDPGGGDDDEEDD